MAKKDYRSSGTGKFVTKQFADTNAATTTGEKRTRRKKIKTAPDFADKLAKAIEGVILIGETDAPLEIPQPQNFRGVPLEQFYEMLSGESVEEFRKLLEENLTNICVVFYGAVRKGVYIIGTDSTGRLHAVTSIAVETLK